MKIRNLFLYLTLIIPFMSNGATRGGDSDFEQSADAAYIPAMIWIDEDEDLESVMEELREEGIIILHSRGNILLSYIPATRNVQKVRRSRGVGRVEISHHYNRPTMDVARQFNDAYKINEGKDFPQPYTGKGVVIGICDIGFDTHHPNFLTSDGKECRIRRVVHYQEEQGLRTVYDTPEEIYNWRTDNDDEWHATHVSGIASGAYKDAVNSYNSLAPDADLVFTASQLSDVGLLGGVEDIIAYAKEVGKPAVINLSMGNIVGPKDGTSLFCQYLDRCAEDAIICISAGNDGDAGHYSATGQEFTESSNYVNLIVADYTAFDNYSETQVWSQDDSPFYFNLHLKNSARPSPSTSVMIKELDFTQPDTPGSWRISADVGDPDYDEVFAQYYNTGYMAVSGGISPFNGRFHIDLDMNCHTDRVTATEDRWAEYFPVITVKGAPGTYADISVIGAFLNNEYNADPKTNNIRNISDLATGHKVIVVGMTNNRATYPLLDGEEGQSSYRTGYVNNYSSYGTLIDGRKLPTTCAPGAIMISSTSGAFTEKHPESIARYCASADTSEGTFYWRQETGTSMSCPYVVSVIANCLQADPKLNWEKAQDAILKTNVSSPADDIDNPRNGLGWLNPYNMFETVLSQTTVVVEPIELSQLAYDYYNGEIRVNNMTERELAMDVYTMEGIRTMSERIGQGRSSYSMSGFQTGTYLVVFESAGLGRKTLKILVK